MIFSTQAFTKLEPNCVAGSLNQPANPILWPDPAGQEPQPCQHHTLYLQMQHMTRHKWELLWELLHTTLGCNKVMCAASLAACLQHHQFCCFVQTYCISPTLVRCTAQHKPVVLSSSHVKGEKDAPMDKTTQASAGTQEQHAR